MIARIIGWSARNKFLVLLLTAAALVVAARTLRELPLDAIPDLSDTQVIIYSRWDRSPDILEDQVTYPIVTALLGTPRIKAVRGLSDFGYSYVYVIFEDGTPLYWARSRVMEYLSKVQSRLPPDVKVEIGPDATSVGWVYQYTLVDDSQKLNQAELRSIQDWQLKFHLQSVPGVAEVASIGGHVKQYQINVDPNKLQAHGIALTQLVSAVRDGNADTGGRLLEFSGAEYMVRGRGYIKSREDIENIVIGAESGVPVLVKHVGRVELGPDLRRGVTDFNGLGEVVGGIVIMRQGENALNVISRVKDRIAEIRSSLPPGVRLVPVYDRSNLIERAISTLKKELGIEMLIVCAVILLFLWHIPSATVPILTIPISVFLAFIPMYLLGLTTNIMSLAGIAISIGVLVDGAIVEVENAYKRLELWNSGGRKGDFHLVRLEALQEVGPAVFFSLLVVAVSFLPIFTLVDQEGRLFSPLAISKTLAMAIAALLAVTTDPALRMLFSRMDPFRLRWPWLTDLANRTLVGTYYPEEKHPISRVLFRIYEPVVRYVLKRRVMALGIALVLVLSTLLVWPRLGSEFMPPLDEGAFLYMPTALPGMSITEAQKLVQAQDRIIRGFDEVETVFGKAGRADTSTDPAPLSMMETTVMLKPPEQWPAVPRWYSRLPGFLHPLFSWITPAHRTTDELRHDLDEKLKFAGIPNIWTMPIKNRIDMLATGIRTPLGIKVLGGDLKTIQSISERIEAELKGMPETGSVFAERAAGGYYLDIVLKREELARYGISIREAQLVIASAIGGENVTYTVEGRERYPVNVRYEREYREDLEALRRVLIPAPGGVHIPLAQVAEIQRVEGAAMVRNENGLLAGYVYIDPAPGVDLGRYLAKARERVATAVVVPAGFSLLWSGQYENMQRVRERMKLVVPLTLILIALLLYLNLGSAVKTGIVLLAVPFSLVGSVWLLYLLGYHLSIAVAVGMIALMGLDAETGVFMLLYLDLAYDAAVREGRMKTQEDLTEAIVHGAVKRVRPKAMTVLAAFAGLLPILWATGAGSDVMRRIAAPMIGGLITSFALELLIYPVVFHIWKWDYGMRRNA